MFMVNELKVWDMRKQQILLHLKGYADTITGVSLSPDGSYVLSNSMDNILLTLFKSISIILKKILRCAWSHDGSKFSAGSVYRYVYIWDTTSRKILYKLPGHSGSVNDVDFSRLEPLILSAFSDKTLYLGEIEDL